jgi:glucosamine 6-phosphate synthetase-like amidotransferase/phosphosugar isomerase protein
VAAIEFCLGQVRKKLANTAAEAFRQLNAEIKRVEQMEYLEQMNSERMEQLESIKRAIEINTLVTSIAEENRSKNNYKY